MTCFVPVSGAIVDVVSDGLRLTRVSDRAVVEKMTRPLRRTAAQEEQLARDYPDRNVAPNVDKRILHPTYENVDPNRPLPALPADFWACDGEASKDSTSSSNPSSL